jgi:hypothetical protein
VLLHGASITSRITIIVRPIGGGQRSNAARSTSRTGNVSHRGSGQFVDIDAVRSISGTLRSKTASPQAAAPNAATSHRAARSTAVRGDLTIVVSSFSGRRRCCSFGQANASYATVSQATVSQATVGQATVKTSFVRFLVDPSGP